MRWAKGGDSEGRGVSHEWTAPTVEGSRDVPGERRRRRGAVVDATDAPGGRVPLQRAASTPHRTPRQAISH